MEKKGKERKGKDRCISAKRQYLNESFKILSGDDVKMSLKRCKAEGSGDQNTFAGLHSTIFALLLRQYTLLVDYGKVILFIRGAGFLGEIHTNKILLKWRGAFITFLSLKFFTKHVNSF